MSKPWNGQTVLIVDDSSQVRDQLRNLFQQLGMKVGGEARHGLEAIEMVKNLHPDLVSLDIIMPEMNGIECFLKLQKMEGDRHYIIISALASESRVLSGLSEQVPRHIYLAKPVDLESLEAKLVDVYAGPKIFQLNSAMEEALKL